MPKWRFSKKVIISIFQFGRYPICAKGDMRFRLNPRENHILRWFEDTLTTQCEDALSQYHISTGTPNKTILINTKKIHVKLNKSFKLVTFQIRHENNENEKQSTIKETNNGHEENIWKVNSNILRVNYVWYLVEFTKKK